MKAYLFVVVFCLSAIQLSAQVQCVTCRLDFVTCNGVQGSADPGVPCPDACICGLRTQVSFLDSFHPGIFVIQHKGKLLVSKVLPMSPASTAGIQVGDELLKINGADPFARSCEEADWRSERGSNTTVLVLQRDKSHPREITLPLVRVKDYLASNWLSNKRGSMLVRVSKRPGDLPGLSPITNGIKVEWRQSRLIVAQILRNSPAHRGGIRLGDRILQIDGKEVTDVSNVERVIEGTGDRPAIELLVERGSTTRTVQLQPEGLSTILRHFVSDDSSIATAVKL